MSKLLVFIPSSIEMGAVAELEARGCESLIEPGVTPLPFQATGPDGSRGTLVVFDDPRSPSHNPRELDVESQCWVPAPKVNGQHPYWVGHAKGDAPGPEQLARREMIDGWPVVCGDGNSWIVPVAEFVPKRLTFDPETGDEAQVPRAKHLPFTERANELWRNFMSEGFQQKAAKDHRISIPGGLTFAGEALAKNYRVTPVVLDLLQLVDEWVAFEIARVACGLPALEDLAKKQVAS